MGDGRAAWLARTASLGFARERGLESLGGLEDIVEAGSIELGRRALGTIVHVDSLAPRARMASSPRQFLGGMGLLARGFRMWATAPRIMALGVIPALITFVLFFAGAIALLANLGRLSTWIVDRFTDPVAPFFDVLRVLVQLALLGGAVLLVVTTFTAVTMAIGGPFFERISRKVDDALGTVDDAPSPVWWRGALRGLGEGLAMVAVAGAGGLAVFLLGLIPIAGGAAGAVVGATVGGWLLALELTAVPFERRGLGLAARQAAFKSRRPEVLGFGVAVFLLFLVPGGALVGMPAAVAGATLLARRALGEPAGKPHGTY